MILTLFPFRTILLRCWLCCLISRTSFPPFSLRSLPLRYVLPSCYHHLHLACCLFPTLQVEALDSGRLDTLFRGNIIACKVLSISFKTFSLYYLQSVLCPLILSLMKSNDLCAMKAVSAVLSGLPLQPRNIHGADMMEQKRKLFLK